MKHAYDCKVDFSTGFLSALDLSGLSVFSKLDHEAGGIHQDVQNLKNDLKMLEDDHLKAIEKLSGNSDGHTEG